MRETTTPAAESPMPTVIVDVRVGEHFNYDFDFDTFVAFAREQGLSDDDINALTIEVARVPDEERAQYERTRFFGNETYPGGTYTAVERRIRDYTFEHGFDRPEACMPNGRYTHRAKRWHEAASNTTLRHELSHHITATARGKWETRFLDTMGGGIAAGIVGGFASGLGRVARSVSGGERAVALAQQSERVGKWGVSVGTVALGILAASSALMYLDNYMNSKRTAYSKWRYKHSIDENRAYRFQDDYEDVQFVHLSLRKPEL